MTKEQDAGHQMSRRAEELAADDYDLEENRTEYQDLEDPETEEPVEVKSCVKEHGGEYGGTGRFRFWKSQHQSLAQRDGSYVLAVYDDKDDSKPDIMERVSLEDVGDHIDGWNDAGHKSKFGKQRKVLWTEFFDPESD